MKQDQRSQSGREPGGARPGRSITGGVDGTPGRDDGEIAEILKSSNRIELWSGSDRKTLRPDLLNREAQERAKALRQVASSQLRRFYGPTVAFKQRLEIDRQVTNSEVEAQVAYLKAISAYAGARKQPRALVEFFVAAANSVKTREDYVCFTRHFEAVMAFHKVFEDKRTER
jgi:CRISPR-associated protein Csm2